MKDLGIKWVLLFIAIIISFIIIYWGDTPMTHVIGLMVLVVVSIHLSDYQLIHPYFWFSGIFALYSCSYPILYSMGFDLFTQIPYSKETMIYQWLALSTFLITLTPINYESIRTPNSYVKSMRFSTLSLIVLHLMEVAHKFHYP